MSLRDDIDALIEDFDEWQEYNAKKRLKTADAILALVRAHLTSDEALERAWTMYGAETLCMTPLKQILRAAILAALGEGE